MKKRWNTVGELQRRRFRLSFYTRAHRLSASLASSKCLALYVGVELKFGALPRQQVESQRLTSIRIFQELSAAAISNLEGLSKLSPLLHQKYAEVFKFPNLIVMSRLASCEKFMTTPSVRKCLFIGGIHGVGKSSLCGQSSKELGIGHHVASALIKRFKDLDAGLYKEVRDVGKNQESLISALAEFVADETYLLDGHFVIKSQQSGLTKIPVDTFAALKPLALVVVMGDPAEAAERLRARDGKIVSSDWLSEMQAAEIDHGRTVGEQLHVPFHVFDSVNSLKFTVFVEKLLSVL